MDQRTIWIRICLEGSFRAQKEGSKPENRPIFCINRQKINMLAWSDSRPGLPTRTPDPGPTRFHLKYRLKPTAYFITMLNRLFETTDLLHLSMQQCVKRIIKLGFPILILTLFFSIFAIVDPAQTGTIFLKAVNENIALETIRILISTAFLCFAVSILFSSVRFISSPVRWFGGVVAELSFTFLSAFLGFVIGAIPLIISSYTWRGLVHVPDLILLALLAQYILWFGVIVAYLEWPNNRKDFIYKLVRNEWTRQWWGLFFLVMGILIIYHTLFRSR